MAKLDQRVNLRIDTETYEAYEKVAAFFKLSVTDTMRQSLQAGVQVMQALGAIIDQANAGNKEAMQELFDTFWQMQRGQLDMADLQMKAMFAAPAEPAKEGGQDK